MKTHSGSTLSILQFCSSDGYYGYVESYLAIRQSNYRAAGTVSSVGIDCVLLLKSCKRGLRGNDGHPTPHYSWTGFYMLDPNDPDTLVLSPFVGDLYAARPVFRSLQGICGARRRYRPNGHR